LSRRLALGIAFGIAVAVFGALLLSPPGADPIRPGQPAPAFTLPRLDGGPPVSLEALRGRVVLVNFWATWCEPCREEFPSLSRLATAYRAKGLTVLGVSTDLASQMPGVEKFLAAQNASFPNYRKKSGGDDQDFIDAVDRAWGGDLPFTVLYGRDGRKAKVLAGQQSYASFESEIQKLLR
jgi:thiol-disulfide isomerase/thioredoxin